VIMRLEFANRPSQRAFAEQNQPSCLHGHSALSRASSRRLRPGRFMGNSDPGDGFVSMLERP
jgi:hypothetical protein